MKLTSFQTEVLELAADDPPPVLVPQLVVGGMVVLLVDDDAPSLLLLPLVDIHDLPVQATADVEEPRRSGNKDKITQEQLVHVRPL